MIVLLKPQEQNEQRLNLGEPAMIGTGEVIVILCVVLILFGGKKLPEFARNLGKGVREFKKACQGLEEQLDTEVVIEENKQTDAKIETLIHQEDNQNP